MLTIWLLAAALVITNAAETLEYSATVRAPVSAAFGFFGAAVAVAPDAQTLLIGAPNSTGSGAVYAVPRYGNGSWADPLQLPANASLGDSLGSWVAITPSGTLAAAGAPGAEGGRGAVLVFEADPRVLWRLVARLTASDAPGVSLAGLGSSVGWSADGSILVAGAPASTVRGLTKAGAAAVFASRTPGGRGGWAVATVLTLGAADAGAAAFAAVSLSADGRSLVAGAYFSAAGAGAASAFTLRDTTVWPPALWDEQPLAPPALLPGDGFGSDVAVSGDGQSIIVGAWRAPGGSGPGAAHVFERKQRGEPAAPAAPWEWTAQLTAPGGGLPKDGFGEAVLLTWGGDAALVGAYPSVRGVVDGAVYPFARNESGAWGSAGPRWLPPAPLPNECFGYLFDCDGVRTPRPLSTCAIATYDAPGAAVKAGAAYVWTLPVAAGR